MSEGKQIRVDFACNDERGTHTDKAERVNIGDLDLECTLVGAGVRLKTDADGTYPNPNVKGRLKVGRVTFWHGGYKYGVGNWCWCAWWLDECDVLRLVNYLMRQKYWHCNSGPCDQFEKFNAADLFTIEDLKGCLDE